jgi:hypothetical protein
LAWPTLLAHQNTHSSLLPLPLVLVAKVLQQRDHIGNTQTSLPPLKSSVLVLRTNFCSWLRPRHWFVEVMLFTANLVVVGVIGTGTPAHSIMHAQMYTKHSYRTSELSVIFRKSCMTCSNCISARHYQVQLYFACL